jgi:hypothetical protein
MDKNPDKRTPTAAAVVELLHPWCDGLATRHMAESGVPSAPIHTSRGAVSPPPPVVGVEETAPFDVLDDLDAPPNPLESPSQISQGTVSMMADTEDTLAGVHVPRREVPPRRSEENAAQDQHGWGKTLLWGAVLLVAGAALGAWLAGLL